MTTEQLAKTEKELFSTVLDIYHKKQTLENEQRLKSVFDSYKNVHRQYAALADKDVEALKRGLFIIWYSIAEPPYLTGISELDEDAGQSIIDLIEEIIKNKALDNELKWMLNYYANWDFAFDRFKNHKGLTELFANKTDKYFPIKIDRIAMEKRGQMGIYWNSLNRFVEP
jgi:hypothetical protein